MLQILLYIFFNIVGFFFFLFVWNRIPKVGLLAIWKRIGPRPLDYTTIPGLKLELETDEKPPLTIEPNVPLHFVSDTLGNMDEIKSFPSFRQFLEYCMLCFGPLNSFYWGPRYVVSVANEQLVTELKRNRSKLLAICPLAAGSILGGDPGFWTKTPVDTVVIEEKEADHMEKVLNEREQNKLCLAGPRSYEENSCSIDDLAKHLRQVPMAYKDDLKSNKSIREILARPLVVVFNEEIDLDAHPVPKYIPIIIHVGALIQKWDTEEVWDKYYSTLDWVPGIKLMKSVEHQIVRKQIRECRKK